MVSIPSNESMIIAALFILQIHDSFLTARPQLQGLIKRPENDQQLERDRRNLLNEWIWGRENTVSIAYPYKDEIERQNRIKNTSMIFSFQLQLIKLQVVANA